MSIALVPVKRLADSKSRLLPELDTDAREALCLAMLGDLLAALAGATRVERRAVVTPDPEVGEAARKAGAEVIHYAQAGLNPAIDHAARALDLVAGEALLVVLGDVAGATSSDLDALFDELDLLGGRGAVLAASSDGGSAALLRAPHDVLPARFGRDSASAHRAAARQLGIPWREISLASLALDLDDADDVERFLSIPESIPDASGPPQALGGTRTRALLRSLGWPNARKRA